jgi:hypothetical protein
MKRLIPILLAAALLASCADDFRGPDLTPELQEPTLRIAGMQAMLTDESITFTEDYLIGGVVTASDESGNFYRSFIVDDLTGAVEVMAGLYDLHTLYPIGRVVYINLKGLMLAHTEGGLYQLGLPPAGSSGYAVDYISHSALLDRYVTRAGMNYEFPIADLSIPQLTDAMIGRLVTIHGLSLRNGGETTWATVEGRYPKDIRATDVEGNWLYIYTSGYADFAGEVIPSGTVSISGILMKNGNRYRLKMRGLRDVVEY